MSETYINNVSHRFVTKGKILPVLKHVSFNVKTDEIIVVLGPSGCGKSTLLRCISGLLTPTAGIISIDGSIPNEALKKKQIGFAFQEPALLEWKTAEQNILLPEDIGRSSYSEIEIENKLQNLLNLIKLQNFRNYYPAQISGGMKQRVALARALLLEPKLLLLDEPFGSLDLLTRTNLTVELSKILQKTKVPTIIVSHSIEEAIFLATRLIILSSLPGSIIEEIEIKFNKPRDFSLFDQKQFIDLVSHSRATLLRHWDYSGDK